MSGTPSDTSARIEEAHYTQAVFLDLSSKALTKLPESICQLTQLRELYLSGNQLRQLPESVGKLTKLQALYLNGNQLKELPESICQLTQLRKLHLSGNQLQELPESICQLTQLRALSLDSNQLVALPESMGQLTKLQALYLNGNQLKELPESICQLTQLRKLHLSGNQLQELPELIWRLTQIHHLILSYNELKELPGSICQLTRLQALYLNGNELTKLPESICQLTQLRELYLSGNQLRQLPESVGKLTKLHALHLDNNQLIALPESLRNLALLNRLYLHGNEKLGLPAEVLGLPWSDTTSKRARPDEILEYYFRVRSGRRPLNEAKLILVGRGGAGKTSIVNRLVYDRFDSDEKKTEGISITEWKLLLNGNENVRLNIWDFGGQEIMHATHQFFLTQRSLYLLVLSGRDGGEDADAEYWLKLIESFGGESPVIIVMSKIRAHPFDLNRRALQQKYPIREFIKTDCEDGFGIHKLRKAIERETDRLEQLRDAFPANWFSIKDHLAGMKQNYLSFDKYRQICKRHGEEDIAAQEALAGYLHNLGIVLNYKDDPRLQDMNVLNPRWITNGIYKILNSEKLERQKGEIELNGLSAVLPASEYPVTMRRFILDLMKKFDLCFSFPDNDTHYLIPELLDKQEAPEAAAFKPEECLNFQYHYPVLPEGLLPRFIVRTNVLSEGLPRWRSGVILKFEGCRAMVKADVQDRKVFIRVSGSVSGRRRLLAVIRSDFERIHRDIRNLQPQEIVPLPQYPDEVVPYHELVVIEQTGMNRFPKVIRGTVIELDVQGLLNGVDLEGARRREKTQDQQKQPVRMFYSYSHRDEDLRNEMETHLKILQHRGLIESWHDRKILAGHKWEREIDENLERADIILLLVSADFISSDYCYKKEMRRAMERHKKGEAKVIPVVVRDANLKGTPFAELQYLPRNAQAVASWESRDAAWRDVSEAIEKAVEEWIENTWR
jgi:internalin A